MPPASFSSVHSDEPGVEGGATNDDIAAGNNRAHHDTAIGIVSLPSDPRPSSATMSTEELRARLEDLPQELYDHIRKLTFEFDFTSEGRCIDRNYKPPFQLRIHHALRESFIKQYYGAQADWIFVGDWSKHSSLSYAALWLGSLPNKSIQEFEVSEGRRVPESKYNYRVGYQRSTGDLIHIYVRHSANDNYEDGIRSRLDVRIQMDEICCPTSHCGWNPRINFYETSTL